MDRSNKAAGPRHVDEAVSSLTRPLIREMTIIIQESETERNGEKPTSNFPGESPEGRRFIIDSDRQNDEIRTCRTDCGCCWLGSCKGIRYTNTDIIYVLGTASFISVI